MSQKRTKYGKEVTVMRAAAETFAREVVPALQDKLALFLGDGECLPDLAGLVLLILRCAQWRLKRLGKAEHAKLAAESILRESRRRRDEACQRLRALLRQLRDVTRVLAQWRGGGWAPMFLHPPLPAQPVRLSRFVRRVCEELGEMSSKPLPQGGPVTFDPLMLARELEQVATLLDQALEEIAGGASDLARAQDIAIDAADGLETDSAAGLRLLSALGAYAGKPHIAKLVRRHRRRSR